jgi:hypothetical protein
MNVGFDLAAASNAHDQPQLKVARLLLAQKA